MSSPGRELVGLPAAAWVELHRQRWPDERLAFQEAAGRVFARVLNGSADVRSTAVDERGQTRVRVESMETAERAALDFAIPEPDEDGKTRRKTIDLRALLLPVAVRSDPTWVMKQLPPNALVEQSNVDALLSALLASVMSDLGGIFELRSGYGPQTDEGRMGVLLRCRETHNALGLRSDLIDPLLDPTLSRPQVVTARSELILSWADHPADLGARLMALLCAQLARAYYSKARKDGTVQEARVINTRTRPLLDATLRDWGQLVDYLGEGLAQTDAQPVEVPDVVLPSSPPVPIIERIALLREWWQLYDGRHASQKPGDPGLGGLVPPRWDYADPTNEDRDPQLGDRGLYRSALPSELVAQIESLWGFTVLPRAPGTLITEPHPFTRFGQLLRPAIEIWEDLASTCWSLCFANWGYPLDEMEQRHAKLRRELERLDAPIDVAVYRELCDAGRPHNWLFENRGLLVSLSISLEDGVPTVSSGDSHPPPAEAAATFLALRRIIDVHRRTWLDLHLDRLLDAMWRTDLSIAAVSYWKRLRGKGSPPTIKQALPDVLDAAQRWLDADFGALARLMGLTGPITQSPTVTSRQLPSNLASVRREVATALRASVRDGTHEPRETAYRVEEVAARVDEILAYWQAVGTAPPRAAVFGSAYTFIFSEFFGCDLDNGYQLLLSAARDTLARSGHPAAADLSPA